MKQLTRLWMFLVIFFAFVLGIQWIRANKDATVSRKIYSIFEGNNQGSKPLINKEEFEEITKKAEEEIIQVKEIDYEVVKPNELGHIMVVMYHGLTEETSKNVYRRKIEDFKNDLKYFHENDYVLTPMSEFVSGKINVPAGKTPIVLTFDDGLNTAFTMEEVDGELKVKEDTAVDIINKFAEENEGFRKACMFYVNGDNNPFQGAGEVKDRFEYLVANGYEVSNHTYSHADLETLNAEDVQKEIGLVDKMIKDNLGEDYAVNTLSLPFGKRPVEENKKYILNGSNEGHEFSYKIAFRAGPSAPYRPYYHIGYDDLNAPRARGNSTEDGDLGYYLKYYEKHPEKRYISDGNPNRLSIPEGYEEYLNVDKLKDIEIYTY